MKILFVCKHNRFRSKVSEAFFKKFNKNRAIKVKSAGTFPDFKLVAPVVRNIMKKFGVKRMNIHPKRINKALIKWADLIIVVANDTNVRAGKKAVKWPVSDTQQNDYPGIFKRVRNMRGRVKKLVAELKQKS